jgi:probable LLM family oxidoreductase
MEVGIDSFASTQLDPESGKASDPKVAISELLDRIVHADKVGLDIFGIGEHHRKEFLDSAPAIILSAAAALTKKIRLSSAVTVISAADPVRVFQDYATLDLISQGRAEMIVGRGSFTEAFPLYGLNLHDYDSLFLEKLNLLLTLRENEIVNWSGRFRPPLIDQAVYPRPVQSSLPIWLGVGGTPASFVRAGTMGLPLMVAIIGGETHRFRPLIELYREAGAKAGFKPEQLKVGLHSLGYVANTTKEAIDDYFPGYAETFTRIGRERGWPPVTRQGFEAQRGPLGALMIGSPEEVAMKIVRHSEALGGISRVTFQMDSAALDHSKLIHSIELIGTRVKPLVNAYEKLPSPLYMPL